MNQTEPTSAVREHDKLLRHVVRTEMEAVLIARLEALTLAQSRGVRVRAAAHSLLKDARAFDNSSKIAFKAERTAIKEDRLGGFIPVATAARHVGELAKRASDVLGASDPLSHSLASTAATLARYAGGTGWRDVYQALIDDAATRQQTNPRAYSIRQMNFAVALNEWGLPAEDRVRAFHIATAERAWRIENDCDEPFVLVAEANVTNIALRAQQYDKPVMDINMLVQGAERTYMRRLAVLGDRHESTQNSYVTFHSIRAEMGRADATWALLAAVGEEADNPQGTGMPEMLPIAICRAAALAGLGAIAKSHLTQSRKALEFTYGVGAPRTIGALDFLHQTLVRHVADD